MALSDADAARLASLQGAYDKLISGQAVAKVQSAGGRMVEYGKADIATLRQEIDGLKAAAAAPSSCPPRTRGSITFRIH
jgi:hypothetical protein